MKGHFLLRRKLIHAKTKHRSVDPIHEKNPTSAVIKEYRQARTSPKKKQKTTVGKIDVIF
jgi:hypothetical protein